MESLVSDGSVGALVSNDLTSLISNDLVVLGELEDSSLKIDVVELSEDTFVVSLFVLAVVPLITSSVNKAQISKRFSILFSVFQYKIALKLCREKCLQKGQLFGNNMIDW